MSLLCIYHGNCFDGFGAAWAVRAALDDVEFYPGVYGDAPPDVKDRDVLMVDFSYKRPVLDEMAEQARSILILDHHKTAAADLAEYPEPPADLPGHKGWLPSAGIYAVFDMDRSGAGLTWDYFHDAARPSLVDYIEDRDLWRFSLEASRHVHAALSSHPFEFGAWDKLMAMDQSALMDFARQGEAIDRKHFRDIDSLLAVTQRRMVIGGYAVPVANMPITMTSDAGHALAAGEPFGACYWDTAEGRVFSLRSTDEGLDVSEIAKQYGGGGHRNAAGFRMEAGWEGDWPIPSPSCNGDSDG